MSESGTPEAILSAVEVVEFARSPIYGSITYRQIVASHEALRAERDALRMALDERNEMAGEEWTRAEAAEAEVERLTAERDALRNQCEQHECAYAALAESHENLRVSRDATFVQLGHAMRVIRDQVREANAQNAADYDVRLTGWRSLNDLRAAEARVAELTDFVEKVHAQGVIKGRECGCNNCWSCAARAVLGEQTP